MKLTYQTAIATLVQFITLSFLTFLNEANSVITTCHNNGSNCGGNLFSSLWFFIVAALWFGAVWLLGTAAQESRSKRLAQLLILTELAVAVIALFNAKHHTDILSLFTSLVDIVLAIWVITLAFRLMRASGGRVVNHQRPRKRLNH